MIGARSLVDDVVSQSELLDFNVILVKVHSLAASLGVVTLLTTSACIGESIVVNSSLKTDQSVLSTGVGNSRIFFLFFLYVISA